MQYREEKGNLFDISNEKNHNGWVLAHCVSSDFQLGLGIALEFDKRYKMRRKLMQMYTVNGKVPQALKVENVYNLVTKPKYWHKPTYKTVKGSLELMKEQMLINNEKKLAMPVIACGLDKLQWGEVSRVIKEVFEDTDIDILVRIKE